MSSDGTERLAAVSLHVWRWAVNPTIIITPPSYGDTEAASEKGCAYINGKINTEQTLAGD